MLSSTLLELGSLFATAKDVGLEPEFFCKRIHLYIIQCNKNRTRFVVKCDCRVGVIDGG